MTTERHLGADGTPFLRLPIRNRPGRFAHIDEADFDALAEGRRSLSLFITTNDARRDYLAVGFQGRNHTVARLLLNPGPKKTVTYRNGDRTDVRRRNLLAVAKKPGGKRQAAQPDNPQPQTPA